MPLAQCYAAVGGNLKIHINLPPEFSCAKHIHLYNTFLLFGTATDLRLGFGITGVVDHPVCCLAEDVYRNLEDEQADYDAGNRLHYAYAQQSSPDTDQSTHR